MKHQAMKEIPEVDRGMFMAKITPITESGCWIWDGTSYRGYGRLQIKGKNYLAHRISYRLHKGPIPLGMTLDHLCRVRCCVNPHHLEAVTNKENVLRGLGPPARNSRKTHCKKGHEFTPDNIKKNSKHVSYRTCRICALEASRKSSRAREAR